MKKLYIPTSVEISALHTTGLMIPNSPPDEPSNLPPGHFVPGPGASYDPQGSIV